MLGRRLPRLSGQANSSSFELEPDFRPPGNEKPEVFFLRFNRAVKGIGIPTRTMYSRFDYE